MLFPMMETAILEKPRTEEQSKIITTVSYNDFKQMDLTGMEGNLIINNMPPAKLYSSQTWIDTEKVKKALDYENRDAPEKEVLAIGYWHTLPTGRRIVVLGDGHHKSLLAWEDGRKINIKMIGELPKNLKFIPFSQFRNLVGKVLG
jgi:hypothetical protein